GSTAASYTSATPRGMGCAGSEHPEAKAGGIDHGWPRLGRAFVRDPQGPPISATPKQSAAQAMATQEVMQWFACALFSDWLHPDRKASEACAVLFIGLRLWGRGQES